jgi:hypothetical protein
MDIHGRAAVPARVFVVVPARGRGDPVISTLGTFAVRLFLALVFLGYRVAALWRRDPEPARAYLPELDQEEDLKVVYLQPRGAISGRRRA